MQQLAHQSVRVQPLHNKHECTLRRPATTKNLPFATSWRRLTQLSEFPVARATGAKVIKPFVDLCQPQLAKSDALEDVRGGTPYTLRIWKLTRETSR